MRTPLIPLLNGFFPRAAALCWWSNSAKSPHLSEVVENRPLALEQRVTNGADGGAASDLVVYGRRANLLPMFQNLCKRPPLGKSNVTYDITRSVYRQIERTLGCHQPERGGLLGGCRKNGLITHFFHDDSPLLANASTYEPNHTAVNAVLKQWNAMGIDLIGMVHSHPGNFSLPSSADCEYARRILAHNAAIQHFFMPIVLTRVSSGRVHIVPYVVERASPLPFALCDLRTLAPVRNMASSRDNLPKRVWSTLPTNVPEEDPPRH